MKYNYFIDKNNMVTEIPKKDSKYQNIRSEYINNSLELIFWKEIA